MYCDCGHGDEPTPESWAQRAKEAVSLGFTAIKFDIDNTNPERFDDPGHVAQGPFSDWTQGQQRHLTTAEVDSIVELVGAARQAVGPEVDVAVDCHWNFTEMDAITLCRELEPLRLMWVEDPVPPDNVEALKRVCDRSPVPVCSGENHSTRHGLRPMIVSQAVDIVQPDFAHVGGLLEAKKVSDLADVYYMPIAAHNSNSPVATIASCQAAVTMRNFMVLEYHGVDVPWWADLVKGMREMMHDGYVDVPETPGLGIELDEDVAREHLSRGSSLFERV